MAYITGEASSVYDIIEKVDGVLCNTLNWKSHMKETTTYNGNTRLKRGIWEGVGNGTDKIYIQMCVDGASNKQITLDGCAGFDANLYYWEQPGSIQQWRKSEGLSDTQVSQPSFALAQDEKLAYWIFADTYRVIVVCRLGIIYESMYVGFINPISSERQYPYPMYVAGNSFSTGAAWPSNTPGSFIFSSGGSGMLRRADGTWRQFDASAPDPNPNSVGTVFPYDSHSTSLVPNYKEKDYINQDNFLLVPIMLRTTDPIDVSGILRGCYWVSGTRDIDAERTLVINSEQYIVFDTKKLRGTNSYFVIKQE